jgi:hypothetical protein
MERHAVHLVLYYGAVPGVDTELLNESLCEVLLLYPTIICLPASKGRVGG